MPQTNYMGSSQVNIINIQKVYLINIMHHDEQKNTIFKTIMALQFQLQQRLETFKEIFPPKDYFS